MRIRVLHSDSSCCCAVLLLSLVLSTARVCVRSCDQFDGRTAAESSADGVYVYVLSISMRLRTRCTGCFSIQVRDNRQYQATEALKTGRRTIVVV